MAPYIHVFISMISVQYFSWSYPTVFYAHSSIPLIDLITSAANFLYYRVSLIASCTISMTTAIITKQHTLTKSEETHINLTTNKQCRYRFPHYPRIIRLYLLFNEFFSEMYWIFANITSTAFTKPAKYVFKRGVWHHTGNQTYSDYHHYLQW